MLAGPWGRRGRRGGWRASRALAPRGEVGGTGVLPVSSPARCRTSPGARAPLPPPLPGLRRRRAGAFPFRESRELSPATPASPPRPPDPNTTRAGAGGAGGPCSPRVCARLPEHFAAPAPGLPPRVPDAQAGPQHEPPSTSEAAAALVQSPAWSVEPRGSNPSSAARSGAPAGCPPTRASFRVARSPRFVLMGFARGLQHASSSRHLFPILCVFPIVDLQPPP